MIFLHIHFSFQNQAYFNSNRVKNVVGRIGIAVVLIIPIFSISLNEQPTEIQFQLKMEDDAVKVTIPFKNTKFRY